MGRVEKRPKIIENNIIVFLSCDFAELQYKINNATLYNNRIVQITNGLPNFNILN